MSDHRKSGQKDRSLKPRMLDPDSGSDSEHPGSRRPERRRSADPTPSRNRSNRRNFPNSLPPDWRPAPFGTLHYIGPEPEGNMLVDWRIPNHLYPPTEAQNQFGRECGACWAFSTVNMVEMMLAKEQNKVDRLSVQAILDCDVNTYGCDGGSMVAALEYMEEHGVPTADVYPYIAENGDCRPYTPHVKVADFDEVEPEDLEEHLQLRPIAAAMFSSPNLQVRNIS
ncbi:cathepsin K [Bemisia tabaci]|uniref:cathepsin K n=1 Tax=Bemisia tabaci TaxID=7038 RepID=UPI003B289541